MDQDLRKLFDTEELPKKKLPANHEVEFLQKLEAQSNDKKPTFWFIGRIAASVVLLIVSGYLVWSSFGTEEITPLQRQVAEIEKTYLKQIDQEWNTFVQKANDPDLINNYKERLDRLKEDYDEITVQFTKEPNSILILEELIENLQKRLALLKNIQDRIQEINKEKKSYESIII